MKEFLNLISVAGSDSSDAKVGGLFFSGKPVIRRAMELADNCMFDSPEKRLQMPLCMDPSDEEEEEEDMEVTIAIVMFLFCSQSIVVLYPEFTAWD